MLVLIKSVVERIGEVYNSWILPADIYFSALSFDVWAVSTFALASRTTYEGITFHNKYIFLWLTGLHSLAYLLAVLGLKIPSPFTSQLGFYELFVTLSMFISWVLPFLALEGFLGAGTSPLQPAPTVPPQATTP